MKSGLRFIAASIVSSLLLAATAGAGSIWAKAGRPRALHSDDTARRIGDILTIVIEERSILGNSTKRANSKVSERKGNITGELSLLTKINNLTGRLFSLPDLDIDIKGQSKFDGDAAYDSSRKMTDQITVTVADVLPNGNLVVVGSRDRITAGDRQTIHIGGVVRPSDISFSNTVRSDRVAEFRIVFEDHCPETLWTKPGWLDRILNLLNPF